jgi:SWI/SNF-related matrix-associated actin-dependent regulator of chromatin subfamily A3
MLAFLQICQPLGNEDFFKRLVLRPLRYGQTEGAELLRVRLLHLFYYRVER